MSPIKPNDVPGKTVLEPPADGFLLSMDAKSVRTLSISLLCVVAFIVLFTVMLVLTVPNQLGRLPGMAVSLLVAIATYVPLRKGDGRSAIRLLSYGTFIYLCIGSLTGSGLQAAILIMLPLIIVVPGLLLGRKQARLLALLSALLCLVLLTAHQLDFIPDRQQLPPGYVTVIYLIVISITLMMTNFVAATHAERFLRVQELNGDLIAAQQEFRTLADNLPSLVMRADLDLICTYVNQPLLEFAQLSQEDIVGHSLESIFSAKQFAMIPATVQAALAGERVIFLAPHQRGEERRIFELMVVSESVRGGATTGLLAVFYDVTAREQLAVELRRSATHDFLTGIANRLQIDEHLQSALARAKRHKKYVALLVIDLDGFKQINDNYGHVAGDHLLKHVAGQFKGVVRSMDAIGRIGGDEFVAVIEDLDHIDFACAVAKKLLLAGREPVTYDGEELAVGASIGVAIYPLHGETIRDLFLSADEAMYQAKGAGKNCYQLASGWLE